MPGIILRNIIDLPAWWIGFQRTRKYKNVPSWWNLKSWSEPSDVPQDASCTHVPWHNLKRCLKWVQKPQWWVEPILCLAWFLIFQSCRKFSVLKSKKVSTSPVKVSTSYVLGVYFIGSRHPFKHILTVLHIFFDRWFFGLPYKVCRITHDNTDN